MSDEGNQKADVEKADECKREEGGGEEADHSESEDLEEDSDVESDEGKLDKEEEEELPHATPVHNKRQSFGLRAKKFMASKTAQTKLGRKVLLSPWIKKKRNVFG